jgi:hypothetical protein
MRLSTLWSAYKKLIWIVGEGIAGSADWRKIETLEDAITARLEGQADLPKPTGDVYAVVLASVDSGVKDMRFWLTREEAEADYWEAEKEWGDGGEKFHVSLYKGLPGRECYEIMGPVPREVRP